MLDLFMTDFPLPSSNDWRIWAVWAVFLLSHSALRYYLSKNKTEV